MSRVVTRVLVCNGSECSATYGTGYLPLSTLRRRARAAGWCRVNPGRDLCPNCTKGGRAAIDFRESIEAGLTEDLDAFSRRLGAASTDTTRRT